jgi:hypothetical protein
MGAVRGRGLGLRGIACRVSVIRAVVLHAARRVGRMLLATPLTNAGRRQIPGIRATGRSRPLALLSCPDQPGSFSVEWVVWRTPCGRWRQRRNSSTAPFDLGAPRHAFNSPQFGPLRQERAAEDSSRCTLAITPVSDRCDFPGASSVSRQARSLARPLRPPKTPRGPNAHSRSRRRSEWRRPDNSRSDDVQDDQLAGSNHPRRKNVDFMQALAKWCHPLGAADEVANEGGDNP